MLSVWGSQGQPVYWFMGKETIVYLSDMGATNLQPLFITCSILQGLFFISTISCECYLRWKLQKLFGFHGSNWIRVLLILKVIFYSLGLIGLILCSCFNLIYHDKIHYISTFSFVFGVLLFSICMLLQCLLLGIHYGKILKNHYLNITEPKPPRNSFCEPKAPRNSFMSMLNLDFSQLDLTKNEKKNHEKDGMNSRNTKIKERPISNILIDGDMSDNNLSTNNDDLHTFHQKNYIYHNYFYFSLLAKIIWLIGAGIFALLFGINLEIHNANPSAIFEWILCFWYSFLFLIYLYELYPATGNAHGFYGQNSYNGGFDKYILDHQDEISFILY